MHDLISRQAAIEIIKNYCENGCDYAEDNWCPSCQREKFVELLKTLPSAQPERIKGHWIEIALSNHTYKCSVCGRLLTNITDGKNKVAKNYPYCHCGADMRGGENDGCSQVFEREESDV